MIRFHAAAVATLAALVWTTSARAEDQRTTARPDRRVVTTVTKEPNMDAVGNGLVMLGISYGASLYVAGRSDREFDRNLYIPVAGPWMDLMQRGSCRSCGNETLNKTLLVADGAFQGIGALQVLGGFAFPKTKIETKVVHATVGVSPARLGVGGYGVTAFGSF